MICEGLNSADADLLARKSGDDILDKMAAYLGKPDVEIMKVSHLFEEKDFVYASNIVENLYSSNSLFKESVESDALGFADRQEYRNRLKVSKEQALSLSIFYLKQEIAVYLLLAQRGWLAEVYVGHEIPTLAKVITGEIPGMPEILTKRVNIGLELKRKKRAAPILCEMDVPSRYGNDTHPLPSRISP
jgi:hypothetical protein